MQANTLARSSKVLKHALLVMATLYIVLYVALAIIRIQYPFELEWMEGGGVDHVARILSGQKLYVRPSLEFVSLVYPPLYFFLSAAASKVFGIGLLPLRLVSFASSLGCFLLIFLIVRRETGRSFPAILACGLFAAAYPLSGAWLDIARVDSLFLLFLLAALYLVRFNTSIVSSVFAGAFISLSFLTKQIALVISVPLALYCAFVNRRRTMFFVGTVVAVIGITTLLFYYIYDGWYNYYIFHLPRQHPIIRSMAVGFWANDIMAPLAIACVMSVFYLVLQLSDSSETNFLFYFFTAAGMLGGAWLSRLHSGGYNNVLLPAYAIIAILFGLGTHGAFEFIRATSADKQSVLEVFVYLCCLTQFALLIYNPLALIPTRADLQAGRKFVNTVAGVEGDVFVPYHGYLPVLAGKRSYAQGMAVADVLRGDGGQARSDLIDETRQAIQEQRFGAIVLDASYFNWFLQDIEDHYESQGPIFDDDAVFWPVSGMKTRPETMYVPKSRGSD